MNEKTLEALKMAQEVLNLYCEQLNSKFANDALKAIDEALAQPAQEPDVEVIDGQIFNSRLPIGFTGGLYTHLAPTQEYLWDGQLDNAIIISKKKEWQGLSDDEMKSFMDVWGITKMAIQDLEASLKEKNT